MSKILGFMRAKEGAGLPVHSLVSGKFDAWTSGSGFQPGLGQLQVSLLVQYGLLNKVDVSLQLEDLLNNLQLGIKYQLSSSRAAINIKTTEHLQRPDDFESFLWPSWSRIFSAQTIR